MNTMNAGRKHGGERGRTEGRKGRPRRKEGRRTEKQQEWEGRGDINADRLAGGPAEGKTGRVIILRSQQAR